MNRNHHEPVAHLSREFLLASLVILLLPVAVELIRPEAGMVGSFLWFVALVPILLWSYAFHWRGTVVTLAAALGLMTASGAVAGIRGFPIDPLIVPIAVVLVGATLSVALLLERMRRDRGSVEDVALTDPLTGLPNRRHARVFLETVFGAAERGRSVSVILFDLDGFRRYNDRIGKREGDEALQAFATLLAAGTRRMNLSARVGGEEFVSILSDADEEGAKAFAERIRESFRLSRPVARELTVSAGVASFHPSMRTPDELVGAADLALYRAKEEGGNRVRVFGRDVRASDVEGAKETLDEVPRDDVGSTAVGTGKDFARDPSELGKSPPPPELLPPADPRFGIGRTVLLVLDRGDEATMIMNYLTTEGFSIRHAAEVTRGQSWLNEETDLVLVDPEILGASIRDFLHAARSRWPATQILLVTDRESGFPGSDSVTVSIDSVLTSPIEPRVLQAALMDAVERRNRIREEDDIAASPTFSELSSEAGQRTLFRGLLALVRAGEVRDPFTRGHAKRVSRYSLALLDEIRTEHGIDREAFQRACLVHDIGKIEIPERILVKNAPLTAEEFGKVRRHPESGRAILTPLMGDPLTLAVTGWHHERWDGSGYPDGLAGPTTPLPARIVSIADALDAMTSPRAYRSGLNWDDAVRQIRERFGTHYDPGLVEPFRAALPSLFSIYRSSWPTS